MKRTSLFYAFSLILVCSSVVHIWAKAPNTAKIVFVSARDGNRETLSDESGWERAGQK